MTTKQASERKNAESSKESRGTPTYRDPAKLRAAYELENGVLKDVAAHFDNVDYTTVRKWLVEYGIHTPTTYENAGTAQLLEDIQPDELGSVDTVVGP